MRVCLSVTYRTVLFAGGRKWRCNLCTGPNDVAGAYFAPLDGHGVRTDIARRPELSSGVVDFLAPAEYMVRPPMAPAYLFVLDVSYYAVQSGLLAAAIAGIRASLGKLRGLAHCFECVVARYACNIG